MKARRFTRLLFSTLLVAISCGAQTASAPQIVDLTAADGTRLKASYFPATKPGPGVLLLHQCNRQRKVWDGLAQQMAAAGINVLTLDLRGFGESGGEPQAKLSQQQAAEQAQNWPGDIDIAFQYLKSQPGVQPGIMGVGGASCGVNNSVQTAIRHPEIKSLVLLSGSTDLNGRRFLSKSAGPVFFAAADDDEFPPTVTIVEWLYSITGNPGKKLVRYKTGGHGADMFPVHPELPAAILDWYVTTLIKTPGKAPASKDTLPVSLDVKVLDLIEKPRGPADVTHMLEEARQKDPKAVLFREDIVNIIGYEHLQSGDAKGAIEILKLNAIAFPGSPNVYDSLGDAFLADGQKDLARQNAQKALDLLASDTADPQDRRDLIKASAQQKLKQLGTAQ